jgi:hypothetical protein
MEVSPNNGSLIANWGLFVVKDLPVTGKIVHDAVCRISKVEVTSYQGIPNYSIVSYQVIYWGQTPLSPSEFAEHTLFVDPVTGEDTFYFTAAPTALSPFMAEGYCTVDFKSRPVNTPASMERFLKPYIEYKDRLTVNPTGSFAVSKVKHVQSFVSEKGLSLRKLDCVLHYRGFVLVHANDVHIAAGWEYQKDKYILVNVPYTSREQSVEKALNHFANGGMELAKGLLIKHTEVA